ncbi:MAG: ThaI family type II restriction endonuclease [Nitrososphaeria archaeon]
MSYSPLIKIFEDKQLVEKIKTRLPYLFQLAELEASRAGKTGMEVGSLRERIIVALLIYKFGEENVETNIPITESEVDVKLYGRPISIKTITGTGGVKAIWTVDAQKASEFLHNYVPRSDIILVQIKWGKLGKFLYIPLYVQLEVFNYIGREQYLKLPKPGTNPRGVEISKNALIRLIEHKGTLSIDIFWRKEQIQYNPYKRWVDYWKE